MMTGVMNMVADPELPASWRKNFYDPLARVFYDGTEFFDDDAIYGALY